jgi:hypothetical protein
MIHAWCRTLLADLWAALLLALPVSAAPLTPHEQAKAFADCAGPL